MNIEITLILSLILFAASVYFFYDSRKKSQQLQKRQIQFDASIESLHVGIILTDTKQNIAVLNSAAKRLMGVEGGGTSVGVVPGHLVANSSYSLDTLGTSLLNIFDLRLNVEACLKNKQLIKSPGLSVKDRYLNISITPIVSLKKNELQVLGTVVLIEDVTEAKVLERSKEEFFSIASHELRTPLTAIRGNTSMIQQYFGQKLDDPNMAEMVEDIHESSIRLIEIVNDFLDTSRLEQKRMQFKKEMVNVLDLANDTFKEVDSLAREKKIFLKVENLTNQAPVVLADKDRTKQVLLNLMGNAIKFTQTGGVTVSLSNVPKYLKVSVSDTGRGISQANQNLLFRKFQQAENNYLTRDNTRGTGLGLYISKLLIEGMDGEIGLESSQEGIGSVFSFSLPLASQLDPTPVPGS